VNEAQNARLETLLGQVQKPARYTGGEMNTDIKSPAQAEVTFAFCFPDTYEIAMSHLGMKIISHIINEQPYALCERVCMPWTDMADGLRSAGLPLFSLESRTPVKDFDIVGFTLQYEMSFTNILEMLDLSGIPLHGCDRTDGPIVVAGGPCAFNPEPLAPFIDVFLIGDGEESTLDLLEAVHQWKKSGKSRGELLSVLSRIDGFYVPSLYEVSYKADGTISAFGPACQDVPAIVRKRVVRDLENAAYPDKIPVPYSEIIHDRIVLEIMRGCTRGCRFCQAGMIYRPVRERGIDRLMMLADSLVKSTGYEDLSLSSLSSSDYSHLPELITALMDRYAGQKVAVSLPSMRIDGLVKKSLEETGRVSKSGLTLAPEAGTQRLRDVINKGVTADDLVRSVTDAFISGWNAVKLYFMIGLPTETDEDLKGIGELARSVTRAYFTLPREQRAPGLKITCSVSTFVPKPFTPFQWSPQDTLPVIIEKQRSLRSILDIRGVTYNWHDPELSHLEACIARGDRRMGRVLYAAWKKGCRLDSWSEHFVYSKWNEAFTECGMDPDFYASRQRERDELLPWAFIDAGVTQDYLKLEYDRALQGEVTADCRNGCENCGLSRFTGVCAQ
jgi:radical SAM family uncharacterized protein